MHGVGNATELRRKIDHVAGAALLEMGQDLLDAVEHRLYVHANHLVDVFIGELRRLPRDALAGVVDPHVDVAEPLDRGVHHPADVIANRDVGDDGEHAVRPIGTPRP